MAVRRLFNKHLVRNISWLWGANLISRPLWLLFIAAFSPRLLGVEGYGIFSLALALASSCLAFSDLGMQHLTLMKVAPKQSLAARYLTNFVVLRVVLLVFGVILGVIVAIMLSYNAATVWAVLGAGVYSASLSLGLYVRIFFRAIQDLKQEAIFTAIEKIIIILFAGIVGGIWGTPAAMLAAMAVGTWLVVGANLLWVAKYVTFMDLRLLSPGFMLRSVRVMWMLGLADIFMGLYMRLDQLMIPVIIDNEALGQYGQAIRIVEALSLFPAIIIQGAIYPRLCIEFSLGRLEDYRKIVQWWIGPLILLGGGVALVISLIGPWFVYTLAGGTSFTEAGKILQLIVWRFPLTFAKDLYYVALFVQGRQNSAVFALLIGATVSVLANLLLLPQLGVMGSAYAAIGVELIVAVLLYISFRKGKVSTLNNRA